MTRSTRSSVDALAEIVSKQIGCDVAVSRTRVSAPSWVTGGVPITYTIHMRRGEHQMSFPRWERTSTRSRPP